MKRRANKSGMHGLFILGLGMARLKAFTSLQLKACPHQAKVNVDLRLTVSLLYVSRLLETRRDKFNLVVALLETRRAQSLTVMNVSSRLTGLFWILNGHGKKFMNRDENGQNMFDCRCMLHTICCGKGLGTASLLHSTRNFSNFSQLSFSWCSFLTYS